MSNNNDKRISELNTANSLDGQELVPIVQSGITKTTTLQSIAELANAPVQSVNGLIGDIILDKSHIGLSNVNNTSDLSKPISTSTQAALDLKANTSSLAAVAISGAYNDLIGSPTLGTAASQNSSAFATALQGTKADSAVQPADLADVAFSGDYNDLINAPSSSVDSVNGQTGIVVLTKSDIGLSNVNNTSDLSKPISTSTQAALDLKANTSSLAAVATSGSFADLANKPGILCMSFGANTTYYVAISGTSYIVAASFYFPGTTKLGTPSAMYAIVSNGAAGVTSDIRIYNPLTSQVIAEYIGFSGNVLQLIDLGSLSNIPSSPTTLEIQMRRTGGSGQSRCHALTMYR